MHTIDPAMMEAWARVLAFGAQKYHQRNFLKAPGMAWSRCYESLNRHLWAFWGGEWLDDESGEPHIAHAMCNLQFLWTYHEHMDYHPGDDRPSSIEYKGISFEEWEHNFIAASRRGDPMPPAERTAVADPPVDILGGLGKSSGHSRSSRRTAVRKRYDNAGSRMGLAGAYIRAQSLVEFCAQNGKASCQICLADAEWGYDTLPDDADYQAAKQHYRHSVGEADGENATISVYALVEFVKYMEGK